ncbi:hypothetical protein UFOVP45_118 [uncultured Caudovirales phage]|uniref:VWFA domain containing protein n=1 Tax=uncultured Caudovirales phage TaxID=2100421 RepID=A0A6J5KT47_9CAUD|nr:hypothetical protein UFOVP45_118 [uncultured Caudovirales phage]
MQAVPFIQFAQQERDENEQRKARMAQVVEQFATRLTMRPVRVRIASQGSAPAWSTSNTISFSGQSLGDLRDPRVITATKGLSLHEVSHILFTPRSGSDIVQWVLDEKLGSAWNILEDQRIETLMVGRFGDSVVPWFTYMIAEHLLANQQAFSTAFPLVRGRKYLPVQVRKAVRDAFVSPEHADEIASIIDEYRTLLFPKDTEVAKSLIKRFAVLVKGLPQPEHGESLDPSGHTSRPVGEQESNAQSKPLNKAGQESARDKAQARNEQDETEYEPEAEDEFNFGDGNGHEEPETETDETGSADADGDSQDDDGDSAEADGDATPDAEVADTDQPSKQAGLGEGNMDSIGDLLQQVLDQTLERVADQIADDIRKFGGEVDLVGERVGKPEPAKYNTATVSASAVRASKSFGAELERLRSEFDPAWEHKVSSGKINAKRYLAGCELDEAFDRWTEGRDDAVDIEAVILLDRSGSMADVAENAYLSMWGLKRALDKVNASTTVVTFDYATKLLYDAEERATSTVKHAGTSGGTSPKDAIKYATRVLADSSRAIKILFTITDGEWDNAEACDDLVRRLRDGGVLTALANIGAGYYAPTSTHEHEITSTIRNTSDLFVLGRHLVKIATQRNLAH